MRNSGSLTMRRPFMIQPPKTVMGLRSGSFKDIPFESLNIVKSNNVSDIKDSHSSGVDQSFQSAVQVKSDLGNAIKKADHNSSTRIEDAQVSME